MDRWEDFASSRLQTVLEVFPAATNYEYVLLVDLGVAGFVGMR